MTDITLDDYFGGSAPSEELERVIILPYSEVGAKTGAIITIPTDDLWTAFEYIEFGFDSFSDQMQTSTIPKEFIVAQGGTINNAIIRQNTGTNAYGRFVDCTANTATVDIGDAYADSSIKFVTGYKKRYATKNLGKTIVLTPENTTGGTFVNGEVQIEQEYVLDIASVLGAGYTGKRLIMHTELYNNSGVGRAIWGEVPKNTLYDSSTGGGFRYNGVGSTYTTDKIYVSTAGYGGRQGAQDESTLTSSYVDDVFAAETITSTECRIKVWTVEQYLALIGSQAPMISMYGDTDVIIDNNTTTPATLNGAVVRKSRDIEVSDAATATIRNMSGGAISLLTGLISFNPDSLAGGVTVLHIISERSMDGITWTGNLDSKRTIEVSNSTESFQTKVSLLSDFQPLEYCRFRLVTDAGTLTLVRTEKTIMGQVFYTHAWQWDILGV